MPKVPRVRSLRCRLSELIPLLLAQACAPGPYHPATPPTPAVAQAANNLPL